MQQANITVKELLPIVVAAAIWGRQWQGMSIRARCDNAAVVAMLKSRTCKPPDAMHLLRCLAFLEAKHSFWVGADHIEGANPVPAVVPQPVLDVLARNRPDWTSELWTSLWQSTARLV